MSVSAALGTSAPLASLTVPLMVALSWLNARGASASSMMTVNATHRAVSVLSLKLVRSASLASHLDAHSDILTPKSNILSPPEKTLTPAASHFPGAAFTGAPRNRSTSVGAARFRVERLQSSNRTSGAFGRFLKSANKTRLAFFASVRSPVDRMYRRISHFHLSAVGEEPGKVLSQPTEVPSAQSARAERIAWSTNLGTLRKSRGPIATSDNSSQIRNLKIRNFESA